MRHLVFLCLCLPTSVLGCDRAICISDQSSLQFAQHITFDDQPSGAGPGRLITDILSLPGAQFGEMFAGQTLSFEGDFDRVAGQPLAPLTMRAGARNHNMAILRLAGTNVLIGDGPAGYPRHQSSGEGAIAVLFDRDQAALSFSLRGGEGGVAIVRFFRRDGSQIDHHQIVPLSELRYVFQRRTLDADIAGFVITNADPDGIALDDIAFEGVTPTG